VPARGAPRDEAAIDVAPQHQARAAATKGSEAKFDIPPIRSRSMVDSVRIGCSYSVCTYVTGSDKRHALRRRRE
jgi:hypothetical protein